MEFDLNHRSIIFTYAVHSGRVVLALQLQHETVFKPVNNNILLNI